MNDELRRAVEGIGGQAALARQVGVTQQAVWNWIHRDRRIPAERVPAVARATSLPRHFLRPDIYSEDAT